jgi:hypothetical protein
MTSTPYTNRRCPAALTGNSDVKAHVDDTPTSPDKTDFEATISALGAGAVMSKVQTSGSSAVCSLRKAQEEITSPPVSNAAMRWKEQAKLGIQSPSLSAGRDSLQLEESSEPKTRSQGSRGPSGEGTGPTSTFHDSLCLLRRSHPVSPDRDAYRLSDSSVASTNYLVGGYKAASTRTSSAAGSIKGITDDATRRSSSSLTGIGASHAEPLSTAFFPAHSATATASSGSAGLLPRFCLVSQADKLIRWIGLLSQTSQMAGYRTDGNLDVRGAHWVSRSGRSSSRRFSGSTAASSASESERMSGGQSLGVN